VGGRPVNLDDLANETDSLAQQRADQALLRAVVANRVPRDADPSIKCRVGNNPSSPYCAKQVILADHALAIAYQIFQKIENLRFDRTQDAIPAQFAPFNIEGAALKSKNHADRRIISDLRIASEPSARR
jgi:hypothetical protein